MPAGRKLVACHATFLFLLRGLVLIIPLAFLLSAVWGMTGIWLAYPAAELMTAVPGIAIYLKSNLTNLRNLSYTKKRVMVISFPERYPCGIGGKFETNK